MKSGIFDAKTRSRYSVVTLQTSERPYSACPGVPSCLDPALKMRTIALIMRAKAGALADVLFGKARGAILGLLYGHPDQSFYYRQITRQLDRLSVGTLQRELDTLSQLGLIDRSTVGKQVFYRVN